MNDDPRFGSEHEPDLDPEREEQVRSLLAGVGAHRPEVPPDVAARLEQTLAGLMAERGAAHLSEEQMATGNVVPLRPRWMPRVAAGAAAVIVLGLGGLTVANLRHVGSGGDATSSADSSDAGGGSALQEQAPSATVPEGGGGGAAQDNADKIAELPQLRSAVFEQDVSDLFSDRPGLRRPRELRDTGTSADENPSLAQGRYAVSCPGPRKTDRSIRSVVRLDARPAALVIHPVRQGEQLVEAWSCDGTSRLASARITP